MIPVVAGGYCHAAERRVDAAGDPLPPGIRVRLGSTRLWHRNLDKIRFTPDGKKLLSLGDDACSWGAKPRVKCRVWDVATGKLLKTLPGSAYPNKGRNYHPMITPDGKSRLQRAGHEIVCRDHPTGKIRWRQNVAPIVPGPGLKNAAVSRFAFSPVGRTVAVGINCGRIVLLDWRTGKYVKGSSRHFGLYKEGMFGAILDAGSVMFSPDGSLLLVADAMSFDDVLLCDTGTGKELRRIKSAQILAWSPDSKRLAQTSWGKEGEFFHVTEAATGKELWKIKASPEFAIFSRDGRTITYKEYNGNYFTLDVRTGKSRRILLLPEAVKSYLIAKSRAGNGNQIAAAPDGQTIAVKGSKDKRELRDARTGRVIYTFEPQTGRRRELQFSPDGKWCAFNIDDHTIEVREAATGKLVNKFRRPEHFLRDLTFTADSRTIALTFNDCTVWLWEAVKK